MPPLAAPEMVRVDAPMMVTGIVISGLGVVSMLAGAFVVLDASMPTWSEQDSGGLPKEAVPVGGVMIGVGALATIVGISLWVTGGERRPAPTGPRRPLR